MDGLSDELSEDDIAALREAFRFTRHCDGDAPRGVHFSLSGSETGGQVWYAVFECNKHDTCLGDAFARTIAGAIRAALKRAQS